jgi:hypothetical protein
MSLQLISPIQFYEEKKKLPLKPSSEKFTEQEGLFRINNDAASYSASPFPLHTTNTQIYLYRPPLKQLNFSQYL